MRRVHARWTKPARGPSPRSMRQDAQTFNPQRAVRAPGPDREIPVVTSVA